MTMSTIQVRIDDNIKEHAKMELEALGLDMSSAIKIFLNKVIAEHGIPFPIKNKKHHLRHINYSNDNVVKIDKNLGYALLPSELDIVEDNIYDEIYS